MEAPRGRGQGGRARGRGRAGTAGGNQRSRGGANQAPLAAQLRQLDRLQEPDEMAVLRRYRDLGATQVRSVYGQTGLLDRAVQIPGSHVRRVIPHAPIEAYGWVSLLQADSALQHWRSEQERERALARREVRLPEARRRVSWGSLTPDERSVLLMSQKEFNSFRARAGTGAGPSRGQNPGEAAQPAPQTAPTGAIPNDDVGEDGSDDGSDQEDEA